MFSYPIAKLIIKLLDIGCLLISQYASAQSGQIEIARGWDDPGGLI
jgi:hypothetical protein